MRLPGLRDYRRSARDRIARDLRRGTATPRKRGMVPAIVEPSGEQRFRFETPPSCRRSAVRVSLPRYLDSVIAALSPSRKNVTVFSKKSRIRSIRLILGSFHDAVMMFSHEFDDPQDQHSAPWMVPGDAMHAKPSMSQACVGTDC